MSQFPLVSPGEEYPNYSSFSCIRTSGSPIYSFKDFYYGNGKEFNLKGKWFLMPKGYHYHHFLKEMLAPYLYYKNNIDDSIKILWVEKDISSPTGQNMELVNTELKKLLSDFNIETINIDDFNNIKLNVDELITFGVGPRFLDIPNFIKHYIFGNTGYYHFPEGNVELRKFFTPYMTDDFSRPKKIFISRKDANNSIKENQRINDFNDRYLAEEIEDQIEQFFLDHGYEILSLSGMSIFDQISYFYNAEKIAGITGSNLCNAIFSKHGIDLYEIFTHRNYSYPWYKEFDSVLMYNRFILDINNQQDIYQYLERGINE
jgi:hypothetical protein